MKSCCVPLILFLVHTTASATNSIRLLRQGACSLGQDEDPVICLEALGNCDQQDIANCNLICQDDSSCVSATIQDSTVDCQVTRACFATTQRRNQVTCQEGTSTCPNSNFFSSAVACESVLACSSSKFYTCSCCSVSAGCPEGVPLCTPATDLQKFCSTLYLGQTCQDWGNPICEDITLLNPPPAPIHPAASCTLSQDVVSCSETDCSGRGIANCALDCNDGECESAVIEDSTVVCAAARACSGSMTRSHVRCLNNVACSSTFTASAVRCEVANSCYTASWEGECNCCDGPGCPPDGSAVVSCDLRRDELCSTVTTSGATCRELGNPICKVTPAPTGSPTTVTPTARPTTIDVITTNPTMVMIPSTSSPSVNSSAAFLATLNLCWIAMGLASILA